MQDSTSASAGPAEAGIELNGQWFREPPTAVISPHADAPLFSRSDAALTFKQVISEVVSGNYPATKAFLSIFRQAALVNLWFFERCVLSYAGPYADIDALMHLEVCNYRQQALVPGARYAAILPRSGLKSTTWTHGAGTWELERDSEIAAGIISYPAERADEFFQLIKSNFEKNALLQELFPENIPPQRYNSRWNNTELVLPARKRARQDPSLKPITAGGATQGIHLDLAMFDDLVGDWALDSDRHATADMVRMTHWFSDNQTTMLVHPEKSRVTNVLTRYGLVDPGEEVMIDSCDHAGDWYNVESWYPLVEGGTWHTYYRSARNRSGESIMPTRFSTEFLDKTQKRNPVGYQLNYANDPHIPEAADLSTYSVRECELDYDASLGYSIRFPQEGTATLLKYCDVVQVIDPAGGRTNNRTAKSSQTAHVIMARLRDGRKCFLFANADFVKTSKWFDWIFNSMEKGYGIRQTAVELQAGFVSLESLIYEEQLKRETTVRLNALSSLGDKDTTIRSILQPELEKGLIYATKQARGLISNAIKVFPGGRKDILDAAKIAVYVSKQPARQEDIDEEEYAEQARLEFVGRNPTTGY